MASWEAAALPQGHRCVINVQIHILELDLCLTKRNVYGVCAITVDMFICHPLHYIHITSYRTASKCKLLQYINTNRSICYLHLGSIIILQD